MRNIRRIVKIHKIEGYKIYCLFNNGESRVVDFEKLFKIWNVKPGDIEYKLKDSQQEFEKVELVYGTFTWKNLQMESTDEQDAPVSYAYDVDPIMMYEGSEEDPSRKLELGMMIKQARKEMGLTQEELAEKSGTTKHYISKIENNKSGIELSTLLKIIEGGLGKRLEMKIV